MDISTKGWTMNEAVVAANYLAEKSDLINVEVDFPSQKMILTLDLDAPKASSWGVANWNIHLIQVR